MPMPVNGHIDDPHWLFALTAAGGDTLQAAGRTQLIDLQCSQTATVRLHRGLDALIGIAGSFPILSRVV